MVADTLLEGAPRDEIFWKCFVLNSFLSTYTSVAFFFPSEALLLLNCSSFQFTLIIKTPNKNTSFIFDIQNAVEFQFQVYNNHFKVHVCNTALFVCFVQSGLQEKNETAA